MATSKPSIESDVFRKLYAKLHDGIQVDPNPFAVKLYSAELISFEIRNKATQESVAPENRASTLLSAVEIRIKSNESEFWKFLEVLEVYREDLAVELKRECEKFKKKSQQCDDDTDLTVPVRKFDDSCSYPSSSNFPNGRALRSQFGPQPDINSNEGLTEHVPLCETDSVFSSDSVGVSVQPLLTSEVECDEELRRVNRFTIAAREVQADCDKGFTKLKQEYDKMREYYREQLESTEQECKSLEKELDSTRRELEQCKSAHRKETKHLESQIGSRKEDVLYMVELCKKQKQTLQEKDSELQEQDQSLREKDSELQEMKQMLVEKDDHIRRLEAKLREVLWQNEIELQEKEQENNLLKCRLEQEEIKRKIYMCKRINELVDQMSKGRTVQELQEIRERIERKVSKLRTSVGGHRKSLSWNM